MAMQRKYLDRGRRIALEGRPYEVECLTLLGLGSMAILDGNADAAPSLSDVMRKGNSAPSSVPRPALPDHRFLRSALHQLEETTMAYLTGQRSTAGLDPLPLDAAAVRDLANRSECLMTAGGANLMTGYGATLAEGTVTRYTGRCAHRMRAMLLRINDEEFSVWRWQFYDQGTA